LYLYPSMKKNNLFLLYFSAALMLTIQSCRQEDGPDTPVDVPEELSEDQILQLVRTDQINTAYYKDIFLDGGCELNPGIKANGVVINGRLPYALRNTGITDSEYFLSTVNDVGDGYTESDRSIQAELFSGTEEDLNGVLLYPDGEPRFRLFYCFGGHSGPHGRTLGESGRRNVRTFYKNGGSYVGSCAGAYLAGKFASGDVSSYFNIWENGNMKGTGVGNSSIDIEFCSDIFENYYGPLNKTTISGVRHNGGGYMDVNQAPIGTEVIALFRNEKGKDSSKRGFYGQPAIWAYKASETSGRLVVTGSHPEDAASGDILNLTSSMFKYAWDGSGIVKVKAVLRNGDLIPMNPGIGDLQCHHFVVHLNRDVKNLVVELQGSGDYDLELYLKKDNFAFPLNDPDFESSGPGNRQTISTGPLEKGLWYVTVRCATTVESQEIVTDAQRGLGRHFVYSGKTGVLNGVPYNITATWE